MLTFGQLKSEIRQRLFPNGEASNLVEAHNKSFIDALIDLQTWVECQQHDNFSLFPQCATFYQCGLTVLDAPRGIITKVSVIDKINPDTLLEDATAEDDWCSEVKYLEVDSCHVRSYLESSLRSGSYLCLPLYFGMPLDLCHSAVYPTPTDEGLPSGLPALPLGYHYPQTSTDRSWGRSRTGVWAKDRGKIFIAPWIQSTETVIVKWDGIKRTWADGDPIDDDPLLSRAVELFVAKEHTSRYDHEFSDAADLEGKYNEARQMLMHQCREETRQRDCEASHARSSVPTGLFYNDEQSASASCPAGQIGSPVSYTVLAGTVASTFSKADANQKALDEAQRQATARLDCVSQATIYTNDAQTATVVCQAEEGAPPPEGVPVTKTVAAGTVTSTISKADANAQALALAQQEAAAELSCLYWNAFQEYEAHCAGGDGNGSPVTKNTPAHTFSSTVSQSDADAQALNDAKTRAEAALVCSGGGIFYNTLQRVTKNANPCIIGPAAYNCSVFVSVVVPQGQVSSNVSQADANQQAINAANAYADARVTMLCANGACGTYSYFWPPNSAP